VLSGVHPGDVFVAFVELHLHALANGHPAHTGPAPNWFVNGLAIVLQPHDGLWIDDAHCIMPYVGFEIARHSEITIVTVDAFAVTITNHIGRFYH
jgi:hypothetical protein